MRIFFSLILIVFWASQAAAQSTVNEGKDNQFWNETQLVVWENDKNELSLIGNLRVGRNISFPSDYRAGFLHSYKVSKYLTLAGGYIYRAVFAFKNRKAYENRFNASATINIPLGKKYKLANRHQVEYRSNNSRPDTRLYRNRLQLEREVTLAKTKITPFGSTEIFYTKDNGWFRIRSIIGVRKKLTEEITGEVFYQRQYDGFSRPGDLNVIGTTLKINL